MRSWCDPSCGSTSGSRTGRYQRVPDRLRGGRGLPDRLPPRHTGHDNHRIATLNVTVNPRNLSWLGVLNMNLNDLDWATKDFEHPVQGTTECWDIVNSDATMQSHSRSRSSRAIPCRGPLGFRQGALPRREPTTGAGYPLDPGSDRLPDQRDVQPGPYEFGWKDTVRCPPNQVTRIMVRWPTAAELGFDPDAVFTGLNNEKLQGYVWHCHLTNHEDNEMMQRMRVGHLVGTPDSSRSPGPAGTTVAATGTEPNRHPWNRPAEHGL